MMDWQFTTRMVLALLVLAGMLYDGFVIAFVGQEYTFSNVLSQDAREYPVITLLTGIALGHLFW